MLRLWVEVNDYKIQNLQIVRDELFVVYIGIILQGI